MQECRTIHNAVPGLIGVLDVTRVRIQRPRDQQALFYSAKDKFHALKFEVLCSIGDSKIMWVNGGLPGSRSDLTIYREKLALELEPLERVMADLGYRGTDDHLMTPILNPWSQEQLEFNREIHRIRQVIERINKRIKIFGCLNSNWRQSHELLSKSFKIICQVTNMSLNEKPL